MPDWLQHAYMDISYCFSQQKPVPAGNALPPFQALIPRALRSNLDLPSGWAAEVMSSSGWIFLVPTPSPNLLMGAKAQAGVAMCHVRHLWDAPLTSLTAPLSLTTVGHHILPSTARNLTVLEFQLQAQVEVTGNRKPHRIWQLLGDLKKT